MEQAFDNLEQAASDCENFYKYLGMYDSEFRRFVPKDPKNENVTSETFLDNQ